jgi:hypothetical protein
VARTYLVHRTAAPRRWRSGGSGEKERGRQMQDWSVAIGLIVVVIVWIQIFMDYRKS